MPRVIMVLLDGLAAATARQCLSYPQALEEAGEAQYAELMCFLPPLSRPAYATLLCGLPPAQSGIFHNGDSGPCPAPTIFFRAQNAGLVTAAAAYYWMSELCNTSPFDLSLIHIFVKHKALPASFKTPFYPQHLAAVSNHITLTVPDNASGRQTANIDQCKHRHSIQKTQAPTCK